MQDRLREPDSRDFVPITKSCPANPNQKPLSDYVERETGKWSNKEPRNRPVNKQ